MFLLIAQGDDHPDTAQTYSNLGLLRREEGNYEAAEEYFQKSLKITEVT
jgi:tetratricopeptide (TPR) repeat protein